MKANKPFDSSFRIALEKYEESMAGDITLQEQFDNTYDSHFEYLVGSTYELNGILSGVGIQGTMAGSVRQGIKIKDLKEEVVDIMYASVPEYKSLPNRPYTSEEVNIVVSDLNEWFRNSGFPDFEAKAISIHHANFPEGPIMGISWANKS